LTAVNSGTNNDETRALSRSRRAAAANKMVAPPPPTLAVRHAGAPPPFGPGAARRGVERANGDITLYVTPEIVKNTDAHAEELQQGTSAAVITGRQEDPGEAPWKRLKWNC